MQKQKRLCFICMAYHEIMRNRPNAVISYQQLKYKVWFMQWNPHNFVWRFEISALQFKEQTLASNIFTNFDYLKDTKMMLLDIVWKTNESNISETEIKCFKALRLHCCKQHSSLAGQQRKR